MNSSSQSCSARSKQNAQRALDPLYWLVAPAARLEKLNVVRLAVVRAIHRSKVANGELALAVAALEASCGDSSVCVRLVLEKRRRREAFCRGGGGVVRCTAGY